MDTREQQIERETRHLRAFQAKADRISVLILHTDLPWVDIQIRIQALREDAERLFPSKMSLFDLLYVSRFIRLWRQWREEPLPAGAEPQC
jgi:hypothetical protein